MKKEIIGMIVCMIVIATCLPVTGVIDDGKKPIAGITPGATGVTRFWPKEHILAVVMEKVYVYESGDREAYEPGEYFFKIFAFPALTHWTTDIYEVGDENPDIPYNFHHIVSIRTKFTPQIILVLALEEDKKEDMNFNEFMDWKVFKVNIPYGDYPPNGMYTSDPVIWENDYFKAIVKFTFHYE